jgi:hypothetical protein
LKCSLRLHTIIIKGSADYHSGNAGIRITQFFYIANAIDAAAGDNGY